VNWLSTLVFVDGALFSLVAVVVFVTPSPQPALRTPVDAASKGKARRLPGGVPKDFQPLVRRLFSVRVLACHEFIAHR
jgi:hypothetical protein